MANPVQTGAARDDAQNKTAAPEGSRYGGHANTLGTGHPKASQQYTAPTGKPRDAGEVRRLRTLLLHAINEDGALTAHTRIVGVFLCGLVNVHTEQAWPSAEHISERLGISKRTVYRAITELENRYFTVKRSIGRTNSNVYRPIWPPEHLQPERLAQLHSRVIAAEAEDTHAAGHVVIGTDYTEQATPSPGKGDNGDTEKVTETAPNLVEGDIYTGALVREAANIAEPDKSEKLLSSEHSRAEGPSLDPVAVKDAFKAQFGMDTYRARFASVRIKGRSAIFSSVWNAKSFDRYHAFLKRQGVRVMLADDNPAWRLELVPSRIAPPRPAYLQGATESNPDGIVGPSSPDSIRVG
jgi:hypothetical protein